MASRIEGLAEPDTVVISADTYRLIQGYFDCDSLGEHDLRGVSQPVAIYRVLGDTGIQNRLDITSPRGLTPLVGRESESTLLFERWAQAKDGHGQVVLLSGEAGIGKSRLVQVLKDHVVEESHTRLECRSSPYYQNTALYPVIDLLQRTLQWRQGDTLAERLEKLEQTLCHYRLPLEETVSLFAALLSLPVPEEQYPPLTFSPQRQREKTLEALLTIVLELAERQPVLFILEDLHWTDPTTLEFLDLLIAQIPTACVYALLTCRPEFQSSWSHRSYLAETTVNRLSSAQVEQVVERLADGKHLPEAVVQQIVEKTDGVPLYVEEMTKAVLESGVLKETNGQYELIDPVSSLSIPATLQDFLMARLDRLATAKVVAQYASVVGRQFSYVVLQAVSELDEATLQRELGRLADAELIYQRGVATSATYTFKHALIQDTAYESLLRRTRQDYHRRIAEVLEERFPETVETQPELVAHHYTEAGQSEQAVWYWQKASEQAIARSANEEAIAHLTKGLTLLETLPDTRGRAQHELNILTLLGPVFMATKGYAAQEVEDTYTRARELCQYLEDTPQLFAVLFGLSRLYFVRARHQRALTLGQQCIALAESQQDPESLQSARAGRKLRYLQPAHGMNGAVKSLLGELSDARGHLEQALELYDAQSHRVSGATQDPGVAYLSFLAWTLAPMGYLDQSLACIRRAVTIGKDLSHPFSLVFAIGHTQQVHQLRREPQTLQRQSEEVIAMATEHGFPLFQAQGTIFRGWAIAIQGRAQEGMALLHQGLETYRATGQENFRPYFTSLLAEAHELASQTEAGLALVEEALAVVAKNEERLWEAELYRLKGELLLRQSADNDDEAATCFHHALDVSRSQQAKLWELRTATSFARLWQSQGRREEARELLEPVYSWFSEGFDTADLIDAKALLDELA